MGGAKERQKVCNPAKDRDKAMGGFVGMSSTGIACMRKRGYGAFLRACISLIALFLVCFMWVDDQQYQQTAESVNDSGESVVDETQAGLDYWVGFLTATGGAISPDKSYWYLLDYRWTGKQWV